MTTVFAVVRELMIEVAADAIYAVPVVVLVVLVVVVVVVAVLKIIFLTVVVEEGGLPHTHRYIYTGWAIKNCAVLKFCIFNGY